MSHLVATGAAEVTAATSTVYAIGDLHGEATLHPRVAARMVRELQGAAPGVVNLFTALSERELEVLRLVADGASNSVIAERLVISEKTVKSHISNILSKLQVLDRTQAAIYAWREGLMQT